MKKFRLTFPFTVFFLTPSMIFGAAQCPGNVAPIQYHPLPHSHVGVSAMVNGSGPYEFMLDTGAQITVIDPALVQELKLETTGSLNIVTVASRVEAPLVTSEVMTVGPVSVHGMRLAVEDLGPIQADYRGLRGILGNNFLSRFDLLIDNSHRMLCFDDSHRMEQSLRGERVPILSHAASNPASASVDAILVPVHLPDDGKHGSVLRLDSGSNVPLLYVDARANAMPIVKTVSGVTIGKQAQFTYVYTSPRTVRFGTHTEVEIAFAGKTGTSRLYSKAGEDGVLPTSLFHRVFISAASHFVIFDPR